MKRALLLMVACALMPINQASSMASDSADAELRAFLRDFHQDTAKTLDRVPVKRDENGNITQDHQSPFSEEDIASGRYIEEKDLFRQTFFFSNGAPESPEVGSSQFKKPIMAGDRVEDLLVDDPMIVKSIEEMHRLRLLTAAMPEMPWADSYWPITNGIIASNYAGDMSPSEKYGLLTGDGGILTGRMLGTRQWYLDKYGTIPGWMGICHGWAGAAIMERAPLHGVTVTGVSGNRIHFFLSDIKGLLSAFWAKSISKSKLIGGRCNVRSPIRDHTGRIADPGCFDTNPGTWHLAAVNQIGKNKRGLVMDATYDAEVWNHPIHGYRYRYFNPQTLEPTTRLSDALIPMADYTIDKFRRLRSTRAKYIVGVSMDVTYIIEMRANHAETHPTTPRKTVTYIYDLELDENKMILGGEWYMNRHPDLLWVYPKDTIAEAPGDELITDSWDGSGPVPSSWSAAARKASSKSMPLAHVIHTLLNLSRQGAGPETPVPAASPSPSPAP